MSVLRFFALVAIFGAVSVAWMALAGSMWYRTERLEQKLSPEMDSLWGPKVLAQPAPYVAPARQAVRTDGGAVSPVASEVTADIDHEYRYKGLLWYSTFTLRFHARYDVPPAPADEGSAGPRFFIFPLPRDVSAYDNLAVTVDEANLPVAQADLAARRIAVPLEGREGRRVTVSYVTSGRDVWLYCPGDAPEGTRSGWDSVHSASTPPAELRSFSLTVRTNFRQIDYPRGTRSPSDRAQPSDGGMTAQWRYANALTNQAMGVAMPQRPNAGPIAANMSFFAPVSLFFFGCVLFTVVVLRRIPLHPMHYLFVAAGFFAFHILMAYLVDVVPLQAAFWTCSAVSVVLVVSYMRLVAGVKFAVLFVGLAQLVYLVGFSYAFLWVGKTGLTITIGAVITLFVLMQATGRVNWFEVFRRRNNTPPLPPRPPGDAAAHPQT